MIEWSGAVSVIYSPIFQRKSTVALIAAPIQQSTVMLVYYVDVNDSSNQT
jgi:hypothetical protein